MITHENHFSSQVSIPLEIGTPETLNSFFLQLKRRKLSTKLRKAGVI